MDIYNLRSFIVLAEQLHFGKAARVLNLSQPALSKQIKLMESVLGGELFVRGKHGVFLSAFGEQFLGHAREVVQRFDQALEFGKHAAKGETGRLRMGFCFHTLKILPQIIAKLRREFPNLQIEMQDMSTAEQVVALEAKKLDVGFLRLPAALSGGFNTRAIISHGLALVVPEDVTIAKCLELESCKDMPFIAVSRQRSPGYYNHMLNVCVKHGFHPRIVHEVTEFTTALALVCSGMGVALIPEVYLNNSMNGVCIHTLDEKAANWQVGVAWHKNDNNPALKHLLNLLP